MSVPQQNFGYGWFNPGDGSSEFSALDFVINQKLARVRTVLVVRVTAVQGGGETQSPPVVAVQPLVKQMDGGNNTISHGQIFGVPVWRLQGGPGAVVADPKVGDVGLLAVSDRDISTVKSTRKENVPGSARRHNLSDGVYLGALLSSAPTQYLAFRDDGVKLADLNGNVVTMTAAGIEVTPAPGTPVTINGRVIVKGDLWLEGNVKSVDGNLYGGNFETAGDVSAKAGAPGTKVTLSTHSHSQGNDSRGDTEQNVSAPLGGT